MSKLLCVSLFAAAGLVVTFGAAQAGEREGGCCGPNPPHYVYSDVNRVSHVTRYRDVTHQYYVNRRALYVHVTRVHPVVVVNDVTRVHERPVERIIPEHVSRVEYMPTSEYSAHHTIYIQEPCICSDCR